MNLKTEFENLLLGLGIKINDIKNEWEFLLDSYVVNRKYHSINHIIKVYKLLEPHFKDSENPELLKLAVLYHDIVYLPGSSRNESESAILFSNRFNHFLDWEQINIVTSLILSTAENAEKSTYDSKLLGDADYASGLIGSFEEFESNNNNIIAEFSQVYPEEMVILGRKKFLKDIASKDILSTLVFKPMEIEMKLNIQKYLTQ